MAPAGRIGGPGGPAAGPGAQGCPRATPGALSTVPQSDQRGRARSIDTAFVLTISDGVAAGTRQDASGDALAERLSGLGYALDRGVVPDDIPAIVSEVIAQAGRCQLLVATGGTGLGARDVTPQALRQVLDYEIPGFAEVMRAAGRLATPMADLSRSLAGVRGGTLVVAVPGSVSGATESLDALVPILSHALETLGGHTEHGAGEGEGAGGSAEGAGEAEGGAGDHANHQPGAS